MALWGREVVHQSESPWNKEVRLFRSSLGPNAYITLWLVSDFHTLLALILFLVGAYVIKPLKGTPTRLLSMALIVSISSYILSQVLSITFLLLAYLEATVKQSYVVMMILQMILYLLALLFLYFALCRTLQRSLDQSPIPAKISTIVTTIHWGILGTLSLLAVANCAVQIAAIVKSVDRSSDALHMTHYDNRVATARAILFMVGSLEIFLWAVLPVIKRTSRPLGSKVKIRAISFATASLFYLVLNFTTAIRTILYMQLRIPEPQYVNAACAVVEFFSVVSIYTGIIVHCMQLQNDDISSTQARPRIIYPPRMSPYIPYRPSIGEVLSQQSSPSITFGQAAGDWKGIPVNQQTINAVMSGGRGPPLNRPVHTQAQGQGPVG
ncbi:uncharacterized protein ATNIH1004_004022 [Aspergillus tanneri]|uniref:Integral membrane protein n=1 Tax=Aspergillus tanneri TaxID=1220188 RepID=A0A5M9MU53_9EURO|nr:uncharacterized protein ATNIH1004_004022 [Aspergillus tanneri]KAA8648139.1 hypothetical protein ATNIH1004_004022 [Aspergillus tanneri]